MAHLRILLPLTRMKVSNFYHQTRDWGAVVAPGEPLYFTVDDGELIVSTEPLGDDPGERLVINHKPPQQGAEDLEGLRDWLAQGGSDNTL